MLVAVVGACAFVLAVVASLNIPGQRGWRLVLAQYVFLLPSIAAFLWAQRDSADVASGAKLPSIKTLLLFCFVVSLPFAWWGNRATSSADESAYHFQARTLASGRLTAASPATTEPVDNARRTEFFFIHHIIARGQWFGKYPPGWPALLAVGHLLGIEWLLNPLLGLVLLWLTYKIGSTCFDETVARGAALMLLLSPMFLVNCVGYYSHVFCGVLLAAATLFCIESLRNERKRDHLLMFILLGIALLVRPFTAFCFTMVLTLASFAWAWPRKKRLLWIFGAGCVGASIAFYGLAAYNLALTGDPLHSTYAMYRGSTSIAEINYQPASVLKNLRVITSRSLLNTTLAIFPFMFLLALRALFRRQEATTEARLLCILFVVLVLGHALQTEPSDTVVGERYYFEALFAVAILAARGWSLLVRRRRFSKVAVSTVGIAILLVQLLHFALFSYDTYRRKIPFARMRAVVTSGDAERHDAVIFMKDNKRFRPADFNLNDVNWRQSPHFYLPDPGAQRRDAVTRALGRSKWFVFSYENEEVRLEAQSG
jgi:hypothetical protein